jgi:hypothetical protein
MMKRSESMLSSYLQRISSIEINKDIREPDEKGIIEILITSKYSEIPLEFTLFLDGATKDVLVQHELSETSGLIERKNLMKITCQPDEEE